MDIVCVTYLSKNAECRIDFTSNDFDCQTCMMTDSELIIAVMRKWEKHEKRFPLDQLIKVEIIAR